MAQTQRTYQLGQLMQLRGEENELKILIDSQVKAIVVHFDPIDMDLEYVKKIIPNRLLSYFKVIERAKPKLDKVLAEIQRLEAEVGETQ